MAENMGKWSSGHPQPAKFRLPGRLWNKTIQLRRNLDIIIVDLEAIWEVSAEYGWPVWPDFHPSETDRQSGSDGRLKHRGVTLNSLIIP